MMEDYFDFFPDILSDEELDDIEEQKLMNELDWRAYEEEMECKMYWSSI